jgi:hypothetical protein
MDCISKTYKQKKTNYLSKQLIFFIVVYSRPKSCLKNMVIDSILILILCKKTKFYLAWSKETLLNSWSEDPIKCLTKCGISSVDNNQSNSENETKSLTDRDNLKKLDPKKIFQFDSEKMIARKMSGRYIVKKKDSVWSLKVTNEKCSSFNPNENESSENTTSINNNDNVSNSFETGNNLEGIEKVYCEICIISSEKEKQCDDFFVEIICGHKFCRLCWQQ